jgi:hypothetical protein
MNIILVTGSRFWTDYGAVRGVLSREPKGTIVLQGGCETGADKMAYNAAMSLGMTPLTMHANWEAFGLSAGPRRNRTMCELFDLLTQGNGRAYAFTRKGKINKGTRDCIEALKIHGIVAEEIVG